MACNCEGKKYNIGMGCCQPVLAPIENYYTKWQVDDLIESATTSGCCITPEEVDEKIESAKTEIEAEIPSLSGYATEQWVLDKNYITGVDLSDYALKSEIPTVPTSNTAFTNDAGYLTEHQHLKTINNESLVGDGNITISGDCDLTNYYTTAQTVNLVESAVTVVEGEIPSLSGYATEQWVLNQNYITGVDLSNYATKSEIPTVPTSNTAFTNDAGYLTEHQHLKTINNQSLVGDGNIVISGDTDLTDYVTFEDMVDYVGDVYTKDEVNNLFVSKQYFQKNAVTYTEFFTATYNLKQEIESLKAAVSACCGTTGETYTRWITVPNDYTCSGTTKYAVEKEQTSTDNINWTDTGNTRRGREIELYSPDCGYTPQVTYKVTMRYIDGTEDKRVCDGSDNLRALNPSNWENISGVTVGGCIHEIGNLCFYGFSGMTSATLHNGITKIDKMAFSRCVSLPTITLPTGLTEIGFDAFAYDSSLESIVIPSGVTVLEYGALKFCTSLTSVTLSEGIQSIGYIALAYDDSLTNLTIPSTVVFIDEHAMAFNNALTSVTCLATTPPTLANQNIFMSDDNLAAIYVPSASVNAYKTAWSAYASLIQPIS